MNLSAIKIAKLVATGIVGVGTSKIVKGVIKANIEAPEKLFDRVSIVAATGVISAVVARETKKYTDETLDSIIDAVSGLIKSAKEADDIVEVVNNLVPANGDQVPGEVVDAPADATK